MIGLVGLLEWILKSGQFAHIVKPTNHPQAGAMA